MELVRADSDFRAQTELSSVVESCAGVDHDGAAVDSIGKFTGIVQVFCNNCFRMPVTESVDVFNRFVQGLDDLD